jgi:hypothetical protein
MIVVFISIVRCEYKNKIKSDKNAKCNQVLYLSTRNRIRNQLPLLIKKQVYNSKHFLIVEFDKVNLII